MWSGVVGSRENELESIVHETTAESRTIQRFAAHGVDVISAFRSRDGVDVRSGISPTRDRSASMTIICSRLIINGCLETVSCP
jgi:hypothetical protein